jgi:hypothetical protein
MKKESILRGQATTVPSMGVVDVSVRKLLDVFGIAENWVGNGSWGEMRKWVFVIHSDTDIYQNGYTIIH